MNDLAKLEYLTGKAPMFRACSRCGQMSSGGAEPLVCFDCVEKADRRQRARELLSAVIPAQFAWSSFESPLLPDRVRVGAGTIGLALQAVGSRRVVLLGESGVGKTSLAVAMLRRWSECQAKPGAFALATDLASARSRENFGRESDLVIAATTSRLLVLDDLGTERDNPRSAVEEVILKRHAEGRSLWVTTWMDPDKMAARYGDGIARRVFEGARIIECRRAT